MFKPGDILRFKHDPGIRVCVADCIESRCIVWLTDSAEGNPACLSVPQVILEYAVKPKLVLVSKSSPIPTE